MATIVKYMTSQAAAILDFQNFSDFVQMFTFVPQLTAKQHLAVEIHEIGRIDCEVVSIQ